MILLIDNYDSFTYNLVHYLGEVLQSKDEVRVFRNDALSVTEIKRLRPSHIVISPGPCTPNEAGISLELVRELSGSFPILGVCLGHQSIGQAFGGLVVRAPHPMHGKTSLVSHNGLGVFRNLANPFSATRYHSLIVEEQSLPAALEVTARSEDGLIMGLVHREHSGTIGVQFHPESIMTAVGHDLLRNFITLHAPA